MRRSYLWKKSSNLIVIVWDFLEQHGSKNLLEW
nr:MAG TPA: hypothetical protein [Caudoviricetes sp.]